MNDIRKLLIAGIIPVTDLKVFYEKHITKTWKMTEAGKSFPASVVWCLNIQFIGITSIISYTSRL